MSSSTPPTTAGNSSGGSSSATSTMIMDLLTTSMVMKALQQVVETTVNQSSALLHSLYNNVGATTQRSSYTSSNNSSSSLSLSEATSAATIVATGTTLVLLPLSSLLLIQLTTSANPIGRCFTFFQQLRRQEKNLTSSDTVDKGIDAYSQLHHQEDTETRLSSYKQLVNAYYDLATVFYEWGWGNSFHFSFQYPFETFRESIRRHEYMLAAQLMNCYGPTKRVLDVGCGIGGPARNISRFLQCSVTGITLNHYQVQRANEMNVQDPYSNVSCIQGDFMHLPIELTHIPFDGAYAIEATCHAPNRTACYYEVYKTLKPGAIFAIYEWAMTKQFDPSNPQHIQLKKGIEEGNGLPDIINCEQCLQCMKDAGFEIVHESDLANPNEIFGSTGNKYNKPIQSWMTPLLPSWNILSQRFQFNWLGAIITNTLIYTMELFYIAPAGTVKTQKVLQTGGFALRDAGTAGIFTTMYLIVGRKPLE